MYNQGDILLVPIPFTDLSSQKRRPVFVLSKKEYNVITDDLIVAAITSNLRDRPYGITFTNNDMIVGFLKTESCVCADKIYTLSKSIVVKRFGTVNPDVVKRVKEKIFDVMA